MYSTMSTASVSIDLGQTADFITDPNFTAARSSRILGPCNLEVNPPFYLAHRPDNNIFGVRILEPSLAVSTDLREYVLQLHFEKIK